MQVGTSKKGEKASIAQLHVVIAAGTTNKISCQETKVITSSVGFPGLD